MTSVSKRVLTHLMILLCRVNHISKRLVRHRPRVYCTRGNISAAEWWVLCVHLCVWKRGSTLTFLHGLAVLFLFGLILELLRVYEALEEAVSHLVPHLEHHLLLLEPLPLRLQLLPHLGHLPPHLPVLPVHLPPAGLLPPAQALPRRNMCLLLRRRLYRPLRYLDHHLRLRGPGRETRPDFHQSQRRWLDNGGGLRVEGASLIFWGGAGKGVQGLGQLRERV